jgi:hypothetical protein
MAAIRFKREPARGIGKAWQLPIEIRRRPELRSSFWLRYARKNGRM